MKHLGDITRLDGAEIEPVDVITGGSPCQDLSLAGKRVGLSGGRSGLFREQMRLVREMRDATGGVYPRFMVWENVPGALSINKGADFREVLNECVKVVEEAAPYVPMPEKGGWPKAGVLYDEMGRWSIAWRIHDAQFWGVPQRRRRIALVCDFRGMRAPEVLFEREGVRGDTAPSGAAGQGAAGNPGGSSAEADAGRVVAVDRNSRNELRLSDTAYALNGDNHESGMSVIRGRSHAPRTTTKECVFASEPVAFDNATIAPRKPVVTTDGKAPTLIERGPGGVCESHEAGRYAARRLTPLECTRLQGYPDGWVDIGDWTDTKGRARKDADTPKYKALGNSIALPFWKWLLARIYAECEAESIDPALGSLFDGIGGFPLSWPGRTVWSSEIEEFPLAVLRARFGEG